MEVETGISILPSRDCLTGRLVPPCVVNLPPVPSIPLSTYALSNDLGPGLLTARALVWKVAQRIRRKERGAAGTVGEGPKPVMGEANVAGQYVL